MAVTALQKRYSNRILTAVAEFYLATMNFATETELGTDIRKDGNIGINDVYCVSVCDRLLTNTDTERRHLSLTTTASVYWPSTPRGVDGQ